METRGEQYDLYTENTADGGVEVLVEENLSEFSDNYTDSQNELESADITQYYGQGPDGSFYVFNYQTNELDLSQPLLPVEEQIAAFQAVLTEGRAEVALLAPGSTETEEIWSLQTLTLEITMGGRQVVNLTSTTEIRKKTEEPEDELANDGGWDTELEPPTSEIPSFLDYDSPATDTPIAEESSAVPVAAKVINEPEIADTHPVTSYQETQSDPSSDAEVAILAPPLQLSSEQPLTITPEYVEEAPAEAVTVILETIPVRAYPLTEAAPEPPVEETPTAIDELEEGIDVIEPQELATIEPSTPELPLKAPIPVPEDERAETEPKQELVAKVRHLPKPAAPKAFPPEKVIYIKKVPPKEVKPVTIQPKVITTSPPIPVAVHSPKLEAPHTQQAEPEQTRRSVVVIKEQQATTPEMPQTKATSQDTPIATWHQREATVEQQKNQPRTAEEAESVRDSVRHNSVMTPSSWEQDTNQNLMPWLSNSSAGPTTTQEDIVITFSTDNLSHRTRRTYAGSLAA